MEKVRLAEGEEKFGKKIIFVQLCTLISFSSGNGINLYVKGVEEGHVFFTFVKYWTFIQHEMIPIIGLMLLLWLEKINC
jgi:hypothetical protein